VWRRGSDSNTVRQFWRLAALPGAPRLMEARSWCWRRDSNSHARRHWLLRPAWLPLHHSSKGALAGARGIEPPSRHRQCPILAAGRRAQTWYPAPDSNRNFEFRRLVSYPLDERDLVRTTGFEPAISRLKVWRLDRLPTSSRQTPGAPGWNRTNCPPIKSRMLILMSFGREESWLGGVESNHENQFQELAACH
jgi:hypothetical protein